MSREMARSIIRPVAVTKWTDGTVGRHYRTSPVARNLRAMWTAKLDVPITPIIRNKPSHNGVCRVEGKIRPLGG